MILVTRFNGSKSYLNTELVYMVEATPDTVITLMDGNKMIVRESAEAIASQIIEYYRKVRRPYEPGENKP